MKVSVRVVMRNKLIYERHMQQCLLLFKRYFGLVAIPVSRTLAKSQGHFAWSLRKPSSSPQITRGLWA